MILIKIFLGSCSHHYISSMCEGSRVYTYCIQTRLYFYTLNYEDTNKSLFSYFCCLTVELLYHQFQCIEERLSPT